MILRFESKCGTAWGRWGVLRGLLWVGRVLQRVPPLGPRTQTVQPVLPRWGLRAVVLVHLVTALPCAIGGGGLELRRKLEAGEPVTIVVFGDSISAGLQIPQPDQDAFFAIFERVLQNAFPAARARVIARGFSGATAEQGLSLFDRVVPPLEPHLVTVQFGGNDERLQTKPEVVRRTLEAIVQQVRQRCHAQPMLLIQPFQQRQADSPMVTLLREVGAACNVPIADFDKALRRRPHDVRGWYAPFFNHPREYSSNIMAQEWWRVFEKWLGRASEFRVEVQGCSIPLAYDQEPIVRTTIHALADAPLELQVRFEVDRQAEETSRAEVAVNAPISIPYTLPFDVGPLPHGRSIRKQVFCLADSGNSAAFDIKWATFAPLLLPARADGTANQALVGLDRTDPPAAIMDSEHSIVLGRRHWQGPDDLSVRFWCELVDEYLNITIAVRDDVVVVPDTIPETGMFFGDCVQLYLDCRPAEYQGLPLYDKNVRQFFLIPGHDEPQSAVWSFGDRPERVQPPEDLWTGMTMHSRKVADGYWIAVRIPLAAIRATAVGVEAIGFDILVDDSDDGRRRETQMVWAGTALNHLKPDRYGAVLLPGSHAAEHVRTPNMRLTVR